MRYEVSAVVHRPIEEVWAFVSDPFNAPRIRRSTWLGARKTTPGPIGVGTAFQARWKIFGLELQVSGRITEWDPPHAYAFSFAGAGFRSGLVRQTLEATANGTKVVRGGELEPRPALKPLWWLLGPVLQRRSEAMTRDMKRLLESGRG